MRSSTCLYRNYSDVVKLVLSSLQYLIKTARGSCVTVNCKKVAVLANVEPQPVLLTVIKDVLERLREKGLVEKYITSSQVKYRVNKESPLWKVCKQARSVDEIYEFIKNYEKPKVEAYLAKDVLEEVKGKVAGKS